MSSKHSKKLVEIVIQESRVKSFGKYLSCDNTKHLHTIENTTSYLYPVPKHLSRVYSKSKSGHTEPIMSTAAILALFDEFSTYGLMSMCKTSRGGVSVHLTTEIVGKISAGQEVILSTSSDKIGKAMGFCTMELQTKDGLLLARGKHIKYMPMGSFWDFIAGPVFLPITLAIFKYLTTTSFGKYLLSLFVKPTKENNEPVKDLTTVGALFTELDLQPVARVDKLGKVACDNAYTFKGKRNLNNLMGKLHGGAVAAVIEQACLLNRRSVAKSDKDAHIIQSMEVRYLAPLKGEVVVTCLDDKYSPKIVDSNLSSRTAGQVINKNGVVSVEYVCEWKSASQL